MGLITKNDKSMKDFLTTLNELFTWEVEYYTENYFHF